VFHEANEYPVFVNPFEVRGVAALNTRDCGAVVPPVFVFPSNVTVYELALNVGVNEFVNPQVNAAHADVV